jgi:hypothetical protein
MSSHASRLAHGPRQAALTPAPARMNRIAPFLCTRRTMASSAGMDNRRWPRSAKRAADASMHRGTSDILDQIFCPPAPGNAHRHRVTRLAGCSSDQAATYGGACIMHCISDPCETNCSRCSRHRSGALSAHTVSIRSIIAHLSSSETRTVASESVTLPWRQIASTPPVGARRSRDWPASSLHTQISHRWISRIRRFAHAATFRNVPIITRPAGAVNWD